MKNKLLFILFFSGVFCIAIYNIYKESGIYYLALGELPKDQYRYEYQDYVTDYLKHEGILKKTNKNFLREDYTTEEFLNLVINANTSIINGEKETITASINESDLITLSLGNNEIENIINSNYRILTSKEVYQDIDKIFLTYKEIIERIRYLTNAPIILIGYYNSFDFHENQIKQKETDNVYEYTESKLVEFLEYENVYLVNLCNEFKNNKKYTEKLDKLSPSIEGYKYIANKIIDIYNLEINA